MHRSTIQILILLLTVFLGTISCEGNYRNVKKLKQKDMLPVGVIEGSDSRYTEKGKLTARLITPLMVDYSNLDFPYFEYPEGVDLRFWGEDDDVTHITSKYAVRYNNSGVVDLREDVVIIRPDSTTILAEQLYWDERNKWLFTDQPYQILLPDGSYNFGQSFDANDDFTTFLSRGNSGVQNIENEKQEEEIE